MLLKKSENLVELSVKQSVIQSSLAIFDSPKSDYVWRVKNQMLMLFVAKLGVFCIQQELS